jgi:glycosyltransferase involved in cell wall biosynthesis
MKSILHVIDTTGPGGAETIFLNLAEKVFVDGYKNIALIKGSGWVEDQLQKRNIEYFIIRPSGFLSLRYYVKLIGFLKKNQVELVQAHLLGSILSFSIVCIFSRIPLVATLHGQVDINPNERFIVIKQWVMAMGVSQLVAVSKNLADFIQTRGLFRRKTIEIIYNGIETNRYYRSAKKTFMKKLGISENVILIGSLGNIRPAKNYNLLIEAASLIKRKTDSSHIHFVIAGHKHPKLIENLNTLAKERNVSDLIHFLGFYDDTPGFLSEIDLFLLCSSSEGFSIATIEAMAAGVPVIATRCGGPEEIITDGVNGILIESNNKYAIADSISTLLNNDTVNLITAGKKHVQSNFSIEKMLHCYYTIYKKFLKKIPI